MYMKSEERNRAMEVASAFHLYRVVGRRPSQVYVSADLQPATNPVSGGHRLWDLVYEEVVAHPGDQLQDGSSGMLLVSPTGESHVVQLSAPSPRDLDSAFTHADRARAADRKLAEEMLADGRLMPVKSRRKLPTERVSLPCFEAGHPLVQPAHG